MLKKDERAIKSAVREERECGHTFCDFDDKQNDLREIAEIIGVEMIYNEDDEAEEEYVFKNEKDEERVKEALNYYYELHS